MGFGRLFQAIERDVRRTSADQDENDLLHEALNRLTTLITSLLTRTLGKFNLCESLPIENELTSR